MSLCFLSSFDIFDVGSLCQAGVVGTLAWVTLARRTWWSWLTMGAGISWLSLGSGLSRASVFTITWKTGWTCIKKSKVKGSNQCDSNLLRIISTVDSGLRCYLLGQGVLALLFHRYQLLRGLPLLLSHLKGKGKQKIPKISALF